MGSRTTQLSSHKFYCLLDCGDFVSYPSRDYPPMRHSAKKSPPLYHLVGRRIKLLILVMVGVLLSLGTHNSHPIKLIEAQTRMIFFHPYQNCQTASPVASSWRSNIQLVLLVVIILVLILVKVKVVLFLGPPTFPTRNSNVILVVVIFVIS